MVRNLPLMETVRCVDAVNTPNRKPQVTNGTEIDRERPKAQVEALTKTEYRGSSPLSSTHLDMDRLLRSWQSSEEAEQVSVAPASRPAA
jgi:hypothetical protein